MKSYTDINQSKKLTEILPIESADMFYVYDRHLDRFYGDTPYVGYRVLNIDVDMPCWSLAALLDYLCSIDMFPTIENDDNQFKLTISFVEENKEHPISDVKTIIIKKDELVDACAEMVLKLKVLNLL